MSQDLQCKHHSNLFGSGIALIQELGMEELETLACNPVLTKIQFY